MKLTPGDVLPLTMGRLVGLRSARSKQGETAVRTGYFMFFEAKQVGGIVLRLGPGQLKSDFSWGTLNKGLGQAMGPGNRRPQRR